jgi:hypothetical protein
MDDPDPVDDKQRKRTCFNVYLSLSGDGEVARILEIFTFVQGDLLRAIAVGKRDNVV